MRYQVRLTEKALQDVEGVLLWFRVQSASAAGDRWFTQIMAAIDTMESFPERCGVAAESADIGREIRELLFGRRLSKYRVLFQIVGRTVIVLRVRHSARDALEREEL